MHLRLKPAGAALAIAFLTIVLALARPVLASDQIGTSLFERRALFSPNLRPFTKWNAVVARSDLQRTQPDDVCSQLENLNRPCIVVQWKALIAELRNMPLRARIARANEFFNGVPYVTAEVNWNDPNHWETPFEFLQRGGQCEDYAIAKLMALAASGVSEQDLRFVVVRDRYLALDHAVAVVYVDGDPFVLDNQVKDVLPAQEVSRYIPYYAINRLGWWYFERPGT